MVEGEVIKKADKGACAVVWNREEYIVEAESEQGDVTVYKDIVFKEKMLQDDAETRGNHKKRILRLILKRPPA